MLLGAQLLQVLAWPFLGGSTVGGAFLGVIGMLAVGSAVLAVRRTPHVSRVVFFLGAPTIVFTLLEAVFPTTDPIVLVSGLLHAPFYFYVSYAMLRYLFHDDKVTTDEYFATGAAFTVVAWGFAYLFAAVQVVWPQSFSNAGGFEHSWFELLYLSFSVLTSVGLSDLVAVGVQARSVVMVEMMTGVFYIAMVVSRMVGLTILRQR
ncbi:two pore domain potassium channel family protein [Nocardioides ganghwensis]|uniref:Two pore domain potassium channel family protein n=2 Tax=Nocardioides ganghwensis TaxID=252230 RepID=A0A4Q2SDI8_9ACTN|nr:two pore domain potassium channel family protein [Nocardioides ganghwensis]RYC03092.1 two pore domain potassium channel family protein [Nocardioides ganghwensis]